MWQGRIIEEESCRKGHMAKFKTLKVRFLRKEGRIRYSLSIWSIWTQHRVYNRDLNKLF